MFYFLKNQKQQPEKVFYALGTLNRIKVFDNISENVINKAAERVMEIDRKMSVYRNDSEISKLNFNAGSGDVHVSKDTLLLIKRSVGMSKESGGAFDITIHPLVELWGIGKKGNYIPDAHSIDAVQPLINYKDILLDEKTQKAALKRSGQALDLGGIAKGYAADEVKRILVSGGVKSAMINLGGNIVAVGSKPDGSQWQIGLQNPLENRGSFFSQIEVNDMTIVTSGSNERFFIKNSVRYHHILDPKTGAPANSSLLSVTVISSSSVLADALSTAAFVLGLEKGSELIQRFQADAVFVTDNMQLYATNNLSGKLHMFPQKSA